MKTFERDLAAWKALYEQWRTTERTLQSITVREPDSEEIAALQERAAALGERSARALEALHAQLATLNDAFKSNRSG